MIKPTMQTANQAPRANFMSLDATPVCRPQRTIPEGSIPPPDLDLIASRTTAYRLEPRYTGLTVRGRDPYRWLRSEVIAAAKDPGDPSTRYAVVDRVYRHKEHDGGQLMIQATHIIPAPIAGYVLRGVDA